MQTANIKNNIRLIQTFADSDPIAKLALQAVEEEIVVPSRLRELLVTAGYEIVEEPLKVLHQVRVYVQTTLIMIGTDKTLPGALIHALYGYMRQLEKDYGTELTDEELDMQIKELTALRDSRKKA